MGIFNFIKKKVTKEKEVTRTIYDKGLSKTREDFVNKLNILGIKYTKIDEEFFLELEEILIMADLGAKLTENIIKRIKSRVKSENITDFNYLKEVIIDELLIIYVNNESISTKINYHERLTTVLMVGVNGVGKTTSIAKLALKEIKQNKKVMLIGADTFRAGACEQLKTWAEKVGASFYGAETKDPAAVVYEGLTKAIEENIDVVFIDTAGRLQNKQNLMKELEKINKVIERIINRNVDETLLVIDASTGQNGISQAKNFKEIVNITGLILTKMDGTAKGGIIFAIKEEVNIPVKFIGFGEKEEDMLNFDIEDYIYGLFKEWI